MTDWTAITGITGIIVSGVVGPTVAARWAASNQAEAAESAIALADRAAARTLLTDAERAVREAIGSAGWVRSAASNAWDGFPGKSLTWDDYGSRRGRDLVPAQHSHLETLRGFEVKAFRVAAQQVDLLEQQVTIMFGSGPVASAYAECGVALGRIMRAASLIPRLGEEVLELEERASFAASDLTRDVHVLPTIGGVFQGYVDEITEGVEQADDAHGRFLQAAHEAIGVRSRDA